MKKLFFLLPGMICWGVLQAQVKEGTVIYERKTNMHRIIQDEQMRAMMPEFRTSKHQLLFSDSISVYKAVPEDEAPDPFAGGGGGPRIMIRNGPGDAGELYKNFAQAKSVQISELGGKNYIIIDSIQQQPWKLGTETKTILGHLCHKATRKINQPVGQVRTMSFSGGVQRSDSTAQSGPQTKEVEVIAWYADDVVAPVGPENFGQLPGVIMALDIDNGATVYNATELQTKVDQKDLKEPKKGKAVTRQEFQTIMMEMMGSQIPGGGMRFRVN
jgi:GLPGLI family protein